VADDQEDGADPEPAHPRTRAGPRRRKPGERTGERTGQRAARSAESSPNGNAPRREGKGLSVAQAARLAARQVAQLTGRVPEGVVSIERAETGWRIVVEVVETHRIPDSADILATYEAELDGDGDLAAYRRIRRYPRGRTQEEPG
jgi:hypothetical protein